MEHHHGGSLADWEGPGSSSEEAIPYNSNIPLETQWFLARASAGNPHPTSDEISLYANHTDLDVGTIRDWFNSQHGTNVGDSDFRRISDRSDPFNPSLPPGSVSAQSDLLVGNSSWIDNKAESIADSGFYSQVSTGFSQSALQHPDYSASQFPLHIATDPSLNNFTQVAQPEGVPDVAWNLRSIATNAFRNTALYPTTEGQSSSAYCLTEYNDQAYDISDQSTTISLVERLQPYAASSEAIVSPRPRSKRTTTSIKSHDGENAICEHCGANFTGRYARGNCSRHVRQTHSEKPAQSNSDLVCRACKKNFKRQDARRKHEWKKHGIPDAEPHPRGPLARSTYEPSHADIQEMSNEQDTMSYTTALPEKTTAEPQYRLPAETHWAYNHFAKARSQLLDNTYNDYCHEVLLYCGRVVEELRLEQSDLQHVFAEQLHDLCTQLRPTSQQKLSGLDPYGEVCMVDAQNVNQHYEGSESGRQHKGKAPAGRHASKESLRHHPYAGRYQKKSGADLLVLALGKFDPLSGTGLDCPMHKWHQMHGQESPCHGCGKPSMNAIRQHLHPDYSTQHRGKVTFIQRCENCKEDFINELLWTQGRHGASACYARSQPRGHSVIVWARLFLKLYPEETEVPSPYQNDPRFLPVNFVALLRDDLFGAQRPGPSSRLPALTALPAVQHAEYEHQNEPESQDLLTRYGQMEAEIARDATAGTLLARASELLVELLSIDFRETNHEPIDMDFVKSFYRNRVNELRSARPQLIQAHRTSLQSTMEQAPHPSSMQAQAQVPAFGGAADFPTQLYQPDQYMVMVQIPDPELNTQPSSGDYYAGGTSFDFTSFDGSSRTSDDCGAPTNMDQSQQPDMQSRNPADLTDCSPSYHNHGLYLSTYDAYPLEQPSPSRLAQQLASAQFMSEVDSTITSPFDFNYALSHAPTENADEDNNSLFHVN